MSGRRSTANPLSAMWRGAKLVMHPFAPLEARPSADEVMAEARAEWNSWLETAAERQ